MSAANGLYFHGVKLDRYFRSNAFLRLERYLECGICYQLSALMMIALKDDKTARLCRGYYKLDGCIVCRHSWVEISRDSKDYIIDIAWHGPEPFEREVYLKEQNLSPEWSYPYDAFWTLDITNAIYNGMQKPETSNVLLELMAFGNPNDGFYFNSHLCYNRQLRYNGTDMVPFYHGYSGKLVTTQIVASFAT